MKIFSRVLCVVLVIIMAFSQTVNIIAKDLNRTYVKDIKIGYGDSGKQMLIDAGYVVNESFNANEGGRGDSVWIGLLPTDDPLEAITDVAVMNMNGDYTFTGWQEEYETLKQDVEDTLEDFMDGVKEFRANYKAGSPYAAAAFDIMNYFIDSYEDDDSFTNLPIGRMLLDGKASDEEIYNVFLMGNWEFISIIKQCIAVACTEWQNTDDTFVTRLNNGTYFKGTPDPSMNHERLLISDSLKNLKPEIDEADTTRENYYKTYSLCKDDYALSEEDIPDGCTAEQLDALQFRNYVEQTCTEETLEEYDYYEKLIALLKNVTINSEEKETLYDLIKKDVKDFKENDFETIRLAFTDGQMGVLSSVGLPVMLIYEDYSKNGNIEEYYDNLLDEVEEEYDVDSLSVYYGVDIDAYRNPDDTALTSDAHTEVLAENSTFGVDPEYEESDVPNGIVVLAGAFVYIGFFGTAITLGALFALSVLDGWAFVEAYTWTFGGLFAGSIWLIIIAVGIFILQENLVHTVEPEDITYTKIPGVIVDYKKVKVSGLKEQKVYLTYTCAKRIDADENSDNSLLVYGDLNQYNKKNEWVAVYYTKNRSCGDPITTDTVSSNTCDVKSGYLAIHDFGTSAATNLNRLNSGMNRKEIYGYIKTTTFNDDSQNMSVFGTGTAVLGLVTAFAAGAVASGIAVGAVAKKKYKKE